MAEIIINKTEYELLTRQSEQVRILERMYLETEYLTTDQIRAVLGLPVKPVREGNNA